MPPQRGIVLWLVKANAFETELRLMNVRPRSRPGTRASPFSMAIGWCMIAREDTRRALRGAAAGSRRAGVLAASRMNPRHHVGRPLELGRVICADERLRGPEGRFNS